MLPAINSLACYFLKLILKPDVSLHKLGSHEIASLKKKNVNANDQAS